MTDHVYFKYSGILLLKDQYDIPPERRLFRPFVVIQTLIVSE